MAKRAEGELMEESFGSVWQVTHRGWRPTQKIAPHVLRTPPLLQCPLKHPQTLPQRAALLKKVPSHRSWVGTGSQAHFPLPTHLLDCSVNARARVECRGARRAPEFHLVVATWHPPALQESAPGLAWTGASSTCRLLLLAGYSAGHVAWGRLGQ